MQPHHRRPPELRIFCIDHPRTVQKTRPTDFNIQALNSKIHYRCRYVEVCKCVTKIMFQHVCFNNPCTKHAKKQQNEQLFGGALRKWHPWFFFSPIMAMAKMAPPPTGGPYWPWPWIHGHGQYGPPVGGGAILAMAMMGEKKNQGCHFLNAPPNNCSFCCFFACFVQGLLKQTCWNMIFVTHLHTSTYLHL